MMHETPHARTQAGAGTLVTIHRQTSSDRFTTIPNTVLRDRRLSARARGVLVYLLSLADGWQTSADRLAAEFTEGRDAIRTALRELETVGYLRRDKWRDEDHRWRSAWTITDDPSTLAPATLPGLDQVTASYPQVTDPGRVSSAGFPATENQAITRKTSETTKRGGATVDNPGPAVVQAPPSNDEGESAEGGSSPWCRRHPGGTDDPCVPCGRARVAHEALESARTAERSQAALGLAEARKTAPACPHGLAGGLLPATVEDSRPWCPLCRAAGPAVNGH